MYKLQEPGTCGHEVFKDIDSRGITFPARFQGYYHRTFLKGLALLLVRDPSLDEDSALRGRALTRRHWRRQGKKNKAATMSPQCSPSRPGELQMSLSQHIATPEDAPVMPWPSHKSKRSPYCGVRPQEPMLCNSWLPSAYCPYPGRPRVLRYKGLGCSS